MGTLYKGIESMYFSWISKMFISFVVSCKIKEKIFSNYKIYWFSLIDAISIP